jgi:hypothetical protein
LLLGGELTESFEPVDWIFPSSVNNNLLEYKQASGGDFQQYNAVFEPVDF